MKSITVHGDGHVEICEADAVSQTHPRGNRSFESLSQAVRELHLIRITEDDVDEANEDRSDEAVEAYMEGFETAGGVILPGFVTQRVEARLREAKQRGVEAIMEGFNLCGDGPRCQCKECQEMASQMFETIAAEVAGR